MIKVAMPARKIPLNYRHITGYIHSDKSDDYTHFEASLERDALLLCEFDPKIKKFKTQPRRFHFIRNGKPRHYTPDIHIEYEDGRKLYVEIKYRADLKKDWLELKPKFKAAIKNATFLLPYKNRPFEEYQLATINKILSRGQPMPLKELLSLCSSDMIEQAEFLNTLWYAVANQLILTELSTPLNMNQLVWMASYKLGEETYE
jgi:hypothetical protein